MKKTPQDFKREDIKQLFDKILQGQKLSLEPLGIQVEESCNSDFTKVCLSIKQVSEASETVEKISENQAQGPIDGIFKACYNRYAAENPSLKNIKLIDFQVKPNFKKSKSHLGTDAKTAVSLMIEVRGCGVAEFNSVSRSMLHSSFVATLKAFQFYINCDKTFNKAQAVIFDAASRNRADVEERYKFYLSRLTEVNSYERQLEN